ncbi:MAG: hypothetical protein AABP62_12880 [Planctomycetota bacterium]
MYRLNNLLPLAGAVIPAIYTAQKNSSVPNTAVNRFVFGLIWGLVVVYFSAVTIHAPLLHKNVPWIQNTLQSEMELLVYIFVVGFGGLALSHLLFRFCAKELTAYPRIQAAAICLIVIVSVGLAMHVLLIDNQFPIENDVP